MAKKYQSKPENPNLKFRRPLNETVRDREHLEPDEVAALLEHAGDRGRHQERDYALILLLYRHGLRAQEAAALRWGAVSFVSKTLAISRLKGSESGVHPLQPDEVKALAAVKGRYPDSLYLFPNERGGKLATSAISRIVARAATDAGLELLKIHPHMLRHSCGYYLANQGYDTRLIQDWLGHRNIQHTVRYTRLSSARFHEICWGESTV